ncbi:class I SAM-dependent methyltransferase [Amycolatopsis sp. NEAU-NG30]|uniref:Class I SAM-dependent methyltransferase n=1 Tax=Amycolatopsis melonis TaxID=3156488 RepID=A0ABV0LAR1_9PSEU
MTADGSLVYLLLPNGGLEIVHAAIPRGASILELGSGAGRVTHPLLALGHEVVAVDDSPSMLAHVRAETVCARIGDLDLGWTFDGHHLARLSTGRRRCGQLGPRLGDSRGWSVAADTMDLGTPPGKGGGCFGAGSPPRRPCTLIRRTS